MSLDPDAIDLVCGYLKHMEAFQTFAGCDTPEAAAEQIVWIDGNCDMERGHALVSPPRVRLDRLAAPGMMGTATVLVEFIWPDPQTPTEDQAWRAFLTLFAGVRRGFAMLDDRRILGVEDDEASPLRLDASEDPKYGFTAGLIITLRCAP